MDKPQTLGEKLIENNKTDRHGYIAKHYNNALESGFIHGNPMGDERLNKALAFLNLCFNKTDDVETIQHSIDLVERLNHFRAACGYKPEGFETLLQDTLQSIFWSLIDDGMGSKNIAPFSWLVDFDYLEREGLLKLRTEDDDSEQSA